MKLKKAKWKGGKKKSNTRKKPRKYLPGQQYCIRDSGYCKDRHTHWVCTEDGMLLPRGRFSSAWRRGYLWHGMSLGCFHQEENPQLESHVYTGELYILKDIYKLGRGHKTEMKTWLRIALKNWALIQKTEDQGKDMVTCSCACCSIYFKHCYKNSDNQLLSTSTEGRMSRNEPNLQQRIFRLDIRKKF